MRSRIIGLALVAASVALLLFGLPLAVGLGQFLETEKRASLQVLADFAARSVQEDLTHDRMPAELPDGSAEAAVALYDEDGMLILGDGPARGDGPVDRALSRGFLAAPSDQLVVATPISDTHDVVGVVRVAVPPSSVTQQMLPIWLGMAALAGLVLIVVWLLARRLVLRLTRPMERLAGAAGRLGDGDFGARADPTGIREVDLIGTALGETARRLDDLLARERAFSAEASHQLRTPLAGLRLRLESTIDRPDRLTRETVEDGLASIDRLERTIDELLQLAREHRAPAERIDVAQLFSEAEVEWGGRLAEEGRTFTTSPRRTFPIQRYPRPPSDKSSRSCWTTPASTVPGRSRSSRERPDQPRSRSTSPTRAQEFRKARSTGAGTAVMAWAWHWLAGSQKPKAAGRPPDAHHRW